MPKAQGPVEKILLSPTRITGIDWKVAEGIRPTWPTYSDQESQIKDIYRRKKGKEYVSVRIMEGNRKHGRSYGVKALQPYLSLLVITTLLSLLALHLKFRWLS